MKQIRIQLNKYDKVHLLPSCYSELDFNQLMKVSKLYSSHLKTISKKEKNAMKIALFGAISKPEIPLAIIQQIPANQWLDLLPLMEWVFETPKFKKWPLPYLSHDLPNFYGPIEMLRTSSFWEMASMDDAYTLASNKQDVSKMYLLIAILYRPQRPDFKKFKKSPEYNGDKREVFNDFVSKERAIEFQKRDFYKKRIPIYLAVAVFLYAKSFHEISLMKKFENLFPKPGKKEVRVGNSYGWPGVILEMSNTKFGDLEHTKNQNWYTVLFEMSRQVDIANSK